MVGSAEEGDGLRARISSLEAEVKQLKSRLAQDAPVSVREALLVEAERAARMGSWMWDLRTQNVYWSDELFRILGKDPARDEADSEAFFGAIHPDDLEDVQAQTQRSIETKRASRIEFRVLRDDGTQREIVMNGAFILDDSGEVGRMVGSCLDVTEWRGAERDAQRARALLDVTEQLSDVGVFFWEPTERRIDWSPEMCKIFGTDQPLDAVSFEAVIVPEDRSAVLAMQREVVSEGEAGPVAFRIRRPNGETRHVLMSGRSTGEGAVGGSVIDITERIHLEEQLRQSQKMDAVGRLAGGVAHDFNNLLTAILGNAELMLIRDANDEKASEVMQAALQASALTRQLLSFSRHAVVDRIAINLNEVADGGLALIERVIGEDVRVVFNGGDDLWLVDADPNQINQILMNLAVNARDSMPEGGEITISTQNLSLTPARRPTSAKTDEFVELRVSDNGVGMDEVTQRRLFEPFFTTKNSGEGTGLGLATVFGIVTQHGGTIEVESRPGEGTEFRVYLPRCEELLSAPDAEDAAAIVHAGGGESILVVEDDPNVRRVVENFLRPAAYRVIAVSTGAAALAVDDSSIAVLLTDLVLPDTNGMEVAKQLRDARPGLKVLYMTGYAAHTGGHTDAPLILKPFSRDQLLAKIRSVLDTPLQTEA
jgi:two-component system, cell cycle sensor histidine kinase and response regulator CckA